MEEDRHDKNPLANTMESPAFQTAPTLRRDQDFRERSSEEMQPILIIQNDVHTAAVPLDADLSFNIDYRAELKLAVEYLNGIIKAIWECKIPPENCVIPPSILLLPVPSWEKETQEQQILIYALDANGDESRIRHRNLTSLTKLTSFPFEDKDKEFVRSGPSFQEKVNLVNALIVFLDEMTGVDVNAELGLHINFMAAAALLEQMQFTSPWPTHPERFEHCGRSIVINDIKIPEFKARLRYYFEQKQREKEGEASWRSSIRNIRFSTMPVSGTFQRVSEPQVVVPRSTKKFNDWHQRRQRNRKIGS